MKILLAIVLCAILTSCVYKHTAETPSLGRLGDPHDPHLTIVPCAVPGDGHSGFRIRTDEFGMVTEYRFYSLPASSILGYGTKSHYYLVGKENLPDGLYNLTYTKVPAQWHEVQETVWEGLSQFFGITVAVADARLASLDIIPGTELPAAFRVSDSTDCGPWRLAGDVTVFEAHSLSDLAKWIEGTVGKPVRIVLPDGASFDLETTRYDFGIAFSDWLDDERSICDGLHGLGWRTETGEITQEAIVVRRTEVGSEQEDGRGR